MKKRYMGLLVLAFILILPIKTNALTGTVGINCSKNRISPNETITCNLSFNTQGSINAISTQLTVESGLTIESVVPANGWQGDGEANLQLYTDNDKTGNIDIATITIKAGETGGVTKLLNATNITITDQEYEETTFDDVSEDIRILSNINTLDLLTISDTNEQTDSSPNIDILDSAFEQNKLEYTINAGEELKEVVIFAELTSSDSSFVEGYGPRTVKLNAGANKIEIKVKAENGSIKTYTVTIVKPGVATGNYSGSEDVNVGDTSKTLSKIIYVISGLLLISGFGIIIYCVIHKRKTNKNETI